VSRFVREIPANLLQEVRIKNSVSMPISFTRGQQSSFESEGCQFQLGQMVRHAKFGDGTVLNYEGQGAHARIQVNFPEFGSKWLVLSYAKLEAV